MKIKLEKQIAKCKKGFVGIITHYDVNTGTHHGFRLNDPHKKWESKDPTILGKVRKIKL